MCSVFLCNICQAFLIVRRNARDMTINVQRSACKVQLLCEMLMELGYCDRMSKNNRIYNFTTLRLVAAQLFHAV